MDSNHTDIVVIIKTDKWENLKEAQKETLLNCGCEHCTEAKNLVAERILGILKR